MDPWMTGLSLMMAAQNPEMGQQLLGGAMGTNPTGNPADLGSLMSPEAGASVQGGPPGTAPGALNPNVLKALAGLQGLKAPAPVQPLMHGGVTGGVKVPDQNMNVKAGAPVSQALIQALLSHGAPPQIPGLGSLIRR